MANSSPPILAMMSSFLHTLRSMSAILSIRSLVVSEGIQPVLDHLHHIISRKEEACVRYSNASVPLQKMPDYTILSNGHERCDMRSHLLSACDEIHHKILLLCLKRLNLHQ